ncbi:MAG: FliM/FliN family flagellar motor switch protein [Planctomycetes bacterium]|nr:FliM/FliN family flagellar motor switch protein [Planctomycetota bacterium]
MADIPRILGIEIPLKVQLVERTMVMREVLNFAPGSVIEFETPCEAPLQLHANGQVIALGRAVKVNEHFGLQVAEVAQPAEKIQALQ